MKRLTALSGLILAYLSIVANAYGAQPDVLPPCQGPGCSVVAVRTPLEEKAEPNALKVRIGSIILAIPPNISRVDLAKSLTIFRYETAPHIMVSTETEDVFQILKLTPQHVSLLEVLEIIFTKTAKDSDVAKRHNNEFLNRLMYIKKGFLEKTGEAYVYEIGRVRIFYIPNGGLPYRNLAWAIDSEHPNTAIRVESDLSVTAFAPILYSISAVKKE